MAIPCTTLVSVLSDDVTTHYAKNILTKVVTVLMTRRMILIHAKISNCNTQLDWPSETDTQKFN